jgi:hypothetical protein
MASSIIPLPYRLLFLYIEPFLALFGALLAHFDPAVYIRSMSPSAQPIASHQVIYDQLAGTYFLFAFNEAIVLRVVGDDVRIWKAMLLGILICDGLHLYGSWNALGDGFWQPSTWRWEDWINLGSLWGQGAVRVLFLMDVGLKKGNKPRTAKLE